MDLTESIGNHSTNAAHKQEQNDPSESNMVMALAIQADEEDWTEQQMEAHITEAFPGEVTLSSLLSPAGSIGDMATPVSVAEGIDRVISILAGRVDGDRKQGLVHVTLAGAWLLRAQFGQDRSGIRAARKHYAKAQPLVPEDDSSTYQVLSMTGMLLSMLDPGGDTDVGDIGNEVEGEGNVLKTAQGEGTGDALAPQSFGGFDLSQLPIGAGQHIRLFDELLRSDDKVAYISEHLDEFDDDFLMMCNVVAEAVGLEGEYEFASFIQAVVAQVEELRALKPRDDEDEEATVSNSMLPGWNILAMVRHGKQARSESAHPGIGSQHHLSPEVSQVQGERREQLKSEMDFVLDLVKAPDDDSVAALMDRRPTSWHPKLLNLLEQVETLVREEGQWAFAQKLRDTRDRVTRVRATRTLETALAYIETEETGRPTIDIVRENPVLQSWEALERLAQWATIAYAQGDEDSASYYNMVICFIGRWFHADDLARDPRCAAWELPLRRYLEQRIKEALELSIQAAAKWTPERAAAGIGGPLDNLPSNLAELLAAWEDDNGEQVGRLGPMVEAGLWVRRLSMEALTVALIEIDLIAHLAEHHVGYHLEQRGQALGNGLQACDRAADLCQQISLDAAAGWYLAVKGHGLVIVNRLAEAEVSYRLAVDIFRRQVDKYPALYTAMWVRTLGNLANVMARQNRLNEALSLTEDAIAIVKEIVQSVSGREQEERRAQLVALLLTCATVQHALGQPSQALTTLSSAENHARDLAMAGPWLRRDALARVLNNKAVMLIEGDELEAAEMNLHEALRIWEQLRAEDENAYSFSVADIFFTLGNLQLVKRNLVEARESYAKAIEIYEALGRVEPQVYNPYLVDTLMNFGAVLEDLGDEDAARTAYHRAMNLREGLAGYAPNMYLPYLAPDLSNHSNAPKKQSDDK